MEHTVFAGSSAVSADDLRALVKEITDSVARGVHESMTAQFAEFSGRIGSLEGRIGRLEGSIGSLEGRIGTLEVSVDTLRSEHERDLKLLAEAVARTERRLSDIDSMMARYDKRLSAIETFPRVPINQPSRLYATQINSVSHPKRVRVGYAG